MRILEPLLARPWLIVALMCAVALWRVVLERRAAKGERSPRAAEEEAALTALKTAQLVALGVLAIALLLTPHFKALEMGWKVLYVGLGVVAARLALRLVEGRRPPRRGAESGQESERRAGIGELLDSALVALALVFFVIKPFVVQAFWIPSISMEDTLLVGDRVVVNRFVYRFSEPRRGDIVVFRAPPEADEEEKEFIKRLIGLPGDRIRVARGTLFVNGIPVEEPYIAERPLYTFPAVPPRRGMGSQRYTYPTRESVTGATIEWTVEDGQVVVPDGHYLMLGDNRNKSHDGHQWGFVARDRLVGRAMFSFWPPGRIRAFEWPGGVAALDDRTSTSSPPP